MTGEEDMESFGLYSHKVLKQVHPDMTLSKKTSQVLNSMIVDMYGRIVLEAKNLVDMRQAKTLSSRDIQSAVRLVLPGELAKHAVSEGTKSVAQYMSTK